MPMLPPEPSLEALARATRIGARLQKIARLITKELDKVGATSDNTQFSLLIWGDSRVQYVSNAERAGVATAMRELLTKWEKDPANASDLGVPHLPLGG